MIGFEFEGLCDTYKSLKYVEKPTESSLKLFVDLDIAELSGSQ